METCAKMDDITNVTCDFLCTRAVKQKPLFMLQKWRKKIVAQLRVFISVDDITNVTGGFLCTRAEKRKSLSVLQKWPKKITAQLKAFLSVCWAACISWRRVLLSTLKKPGPRWSSLTHSQCSFQARSADFVCLQQNLQKYVRLMIYFMDFRVYVHSIYSDLLFSSKDEALCWSNEHGTSRGGCFGKKVMILPSVEIKFQSAIETGNPDAYDRESHRKDLFDVAFSEKVIYD